MQVLSKNGKSFLRRFNPRFILKLYKSGTGTAYTEPNVIYGGDLPNPTPNQSFGSILFNRMMRPERRDHVFQVDVKTRVEMSTKECLEKSVALAKRFQEEGVKKGDFILLTGNNSLNLNISLIGAFLIGAIPFPMNNKAHLDHVRSVVTFLKPKYFGCDGKYLFYFKKALIDSPGFDASKIFVLNPWDTGEIETFPSFEDFIKGREENFESFKPVEVTNLKDELALLLKFSTENTDAKLIGLTHFNLNSVVARFDSLESHRNFKDEVNLMVQKVTWMSGIYSLIMSCCYGSKLIVLEKFEELSFLKAIEEYRVTTTFLYAMNCWQLLKFSSDIQFDLSSCTNFYSVDAVTPSLFEDKLRDKYGFTTKNSYGFSEFSGSLLENDGNMNNDSTGKLVPQIYGKVISDKNKNAGPNEKGELCFKGPTLCKGYMNDEKGFKNSMDSKGFFLTGHYGYYNENGEFFIIDKITHQIQYKNYKISPRELENIIRTLDSVKDVCVAGLNHETEGSYPLAFVSIQKGRTITEQDIIKFVNAKVPDFKRIRGVVFIPKVPRNTENRGINRNLFKKALAHFRVKNSSKSPELSNKDSPSGDKQTEADKKINS